jgi:hypothetical protein
MLKKEERHCNIDFKNPIKNTKQEVSLEKQSTLVNNGTQVILSGA